MAGKIKVRFNIIDFLIVALVLLAVIALFLRPTVVKQIERLSAADTVTVSFVADQVTAEQLEQLNEGDVLRAEGERIGELTSFSSRPAQTIRLVSPNSDTETAYYQKATLSDLYTVTGQLKLTGSDRENGFYVGGELYVGVGTVLYLEADSYVLAVQINGIS